jgi:hypothetical protein
MLDDVENGTSDLKMVDTSNQDEVNKYNKRHEEIVTDGHGKGNLIYVCNGEMNKDHLLKGNETTGFLTAQTRNNMIVNGSGGRLTFADLEITGTHSILMMSIRIPTLLLQVHSNRMMSIRNWMVTIRILASKST